MHLKSTRNPVAAYAELPRGVSFDDQKPSEEVKLLLRQHFITNLKWIFLFGLAALFPILVYELRGWEEASMGWFQSVPIEVLDVMVLMWYVWIIGFTLESFFIWYYSVFLITNYRVVDNDFKGLLHYTSTEAALHQIQDVTHKQSGIWQLLFNYGNVHIETAGSRENITFEKVPKPARVADILTDLLPKPNDYTYPDSVPAEERKELPRKELYRGGQSKVKDEPERGAQTTDESPASTYKVQKGLTRKEYDS